MTPIEILKKSKEIKETALIKFNNLCHSEILPIAYDKAIQGALQSLTIKLLEGEKARLGGLSKPEFGRFITNDDSLENKGYNDCLEDQIAYLSAQLSEIKKI